jgi:hypothetical protein
MEFANVDCINFNYILKNVTDSHCPTADTDYERDWPRCSEEPYYFNNPWRVMFFIAEVVVPDYMEFIRTSDNYLLQKIKSIEGMEFMMTFDFPAGQPPPRFTSCFFLRLYNLYVMNVYIPVLGIAFTFVALNAGVLITFIGNLSYFIGLSALFIANCLTGNNVDGAIDDVLDGRDYVIGNVINFKNIDKMDKRRLNDYLEMTYGESKAVFSYGEESSSGMGKIKSVASKFLNNVILRRKKLKKS